MEQKTSRRRSWRLRKRRFSRYDDHYSKHFCSVSYEFLANLLARGQLLHVNLQAINTCVSAAPLMMTGIQFAIQNLLARAVLRFGIVKRSANAVELDWHQYSRQGMVTQQHVCTSTDCNEYAACLHRKSTAISSFFACNDHIQQNVIHTCTAHGHHQHVSSPTLLC